MLWRAVGSEHGGLLGRGNVLFGKLKSALAELQTSLGWREVREHEKSVIAKVGNLLVGEVVAHDDVNRSGS
ncbi:MAG: hypothetical protein ACKOE7_10045 [Actinomycetota bacterium]